MLNDWIILVLGRENRPLRIEELAVLLNSERSLNREGEGKLTSPELRAHIESFPSQFTLINGWVVSSSDKKWGKFISLFEYMGAILGGAFRTDELQFVIGGMIVYKRLWELRGESSYPVHIEESAIGFSKLNYANKAEAGLFRSLNEIEKNNNFAVPVFSELVRLLRRLPLGTINELAAVLEKVDIIDFSDSDFSIAFEYILDARNTDSRRRPELSRTPDAVVDLMVNLLDPKQGSVFDPMCGTGSLLTRIAHIFPNIKRLVGIEINERAATFAFINLLLCTKERPNITVKNCFEELHSDLSYDYIVSDLPIAPVFSNAEILELGARYDINMPRNNKGFAASVLFVFAKLSRRGKAVLTVSETFLSGGGIDERVRQFLVQEDVIEAVISLPPNSLRPYANGKASLIVLNKSKPSYLIGRVKFIEVDGAKIQKNNEVFDIADILKKYKSKRIDEKGIQLVDADRILNMNTLQVAYYSENFHLIGEFISDRSGVSLGELVEIRRGVDLIDKEDASHQEGIPFVRIENLERDILDMGLSSQGLRSFFADYLLYEKVIISQEALLIARIGDNLKPTYFKPTKNIPCIVAHTNVLILTARTDGPAINFEYLYYQLYSAFIQKQIERKRQGAIMPFISIKSIKGLIVPVMGASAQAEFVSTQKANIITAEREKVNQRLKLIGFDERDMQKESDIVSTLVHELRPKLISIHSMAEKMSRIIEKHGVSGLTEYENSTDDQLDPDLIGMLAPPENLAFGELNEKLIKNAQDLSETLSVVQKVMNFNLNHDDFITTDILSLIIGYFSSKNGDIGASYRYEVRGIHVTARVNPRSFEQMLDQLLANAVRHAFSSPSLTNVVNFNVGHNKERRLATIEYSNNGAPFILTEQDFVGFFHKSKTSVGSGIGGNFIYRVVKAHGGDLRVREENKKGFSLVIELPLRDDVL